MDDFIKYGFFDASEFKDGLIFHAHGAILRKTNIE